MTTSIASGSATARTYEVRTYGCQMNVHDSERLSGLLEDAGYLKATEGTQADVVVFNTCAVRENADNKLYGNLSHLAPIKEANPDLQIAVGGCLAQKDRATITEKAPYVDVVFGTHNIGSLPVLLERARVQEEAQVEILESLEVFPSTLPTKRESAYAAWVSVSVGCNNTCTFCIVPSLRGKEKDRRPGEILAEIETLVAEGVSEVTLLGQNVNTYGVEFGDRFAFGKLLRACGEIEGLERVRFTSPHPAAFTDDVIEAMAETANVCHQLHMPLQSGSDEVLRAMKRSYRSDRYLSIIDKVRAAMPDAAITTDIIVGFPGETEEDFERTVARHGDREALVEIATGRRWTYAELDADVDALAVGLRKAGIGKGDRVGIWAPNCAEWTMVQFATAKIGAILVNINPAYRSSELDYALQQSGCRWLVCADAFKTSDYHAMLVQLLPELATSQPGELRSARLPELRGVISLAAQAPAGFLRWHELAGLATQVSVEQLAARQALLYGLDRQSICDTLLAGRWSEALELLHKIPARDRAKDFLTIFIAQHNYEPPPNWDGVIPMPSK